MTGLNEMRCVCTGCSCLCDDTVIETNADDTSNRISNICKKGYALFAVSDSSNARRDGIVRNKVVVDVEDSIKEAGHLLAQAKYSMTFGLDRCLCEVPLSAVNLAEHFNGMKERYHGCRECVEVCEQELNKSRDTCGGRKTEISPVIKAIDGLIRVVSWSGWKRPPVTANCAKRGVFSVHRNLQQIKKPSNGG